MKLISKLLSAHISTPQTIGFLVANLAGLFIVMASVQFFFDARPLLKGDESIIKDTYLILSKHITSLHGEESFFTQEETETLSEFNGVERFGTFTPSLYEVSAAVALGNSGARLSTDMFFESVPDEFVDIDKTRWHYKEGSKSVPIVLPKDYLDLYNFGFAKSKDMPMLSERLLSMIAIEIIAVQHIVLGGAFIFYGDADGGHPPAECLRLTLSMRTGGIPVARPCLKYLR